MKAKTEQPIKVVRLDQYGNEIEAPKKPTELIKLAQLDGVYSAIEYTAWLKGYMACLNEFEKEMK